MDRYSKMAPYLHYGFVTTELGITEADIFRAARNGEIELHARGVSPNKVWIDRPTVRKLFQAAFGEDPGYEQMIAQFTRFAEEDRIPIQCYSPGGRVWGFPLRYMTTFYPGYHKAEPAQCRHVAEMLEAHNFKRLGLRRVEKRQVTCFAPPEDMVIAKHGDDRSQEKIAQVWTLFYTAPEGRVTVSDVVVHCSVTRYEAAVLLKQSGAQRLGQKRVAGNLETVYILPEKPQERPEGRHG